jgi:hypothetical protein
LLTDRDKINILYRGSAIDASYQVSVHLAKQFQRRFFLIGQSETRIACGCHLCQWQDELKKNGRICPQDTDAPCFLPKLSKQGHNSRKDKVVKSGKKTWSSIYDP